MAVTLKKSNFTVWIDNIIDDLDQNGFEPCEKVFLKAVAWYRIKLLNGTHSSDERKQIALTIMLLYKVASYLFKGNDFVSSDFYSSFEETTKIVYKISPELIGFLKINSSHYSELTDREIDILTSLDFREYFFKEINNRFSLITESYAEGIISSRTLWAKGYEQVYGKYKEEIKDIFS